MIGLAILAVFAVYIWITVVLARVATAYVRAHHLPGWLGGATISVIMFLLVFWDWIPTAVAHHYYCSTRAGFKVIKTLEQWQAENPGVAETLVPARMGTTVKRPDGEGYTLNQRFEWRVTERVVFLTVKEIVEGLYDLKDPKAGASEELLNVRTDYSAGTGWFPADANTLQDYKFWLVVRSCDEIGYPTFRDVAGKFVRTVEEIGKPAGPSSRRSAR